MKNIVDKCILLISASLVFVLFGILSYRPKPIVYNFTDFSAKDMYVELPDIERPEPEKLEPKVVDNYLEFKRKMGEIPLSGTRVVLNNAYRIFITAYCAEECGWNYWTSSGTECHRANEVYRYAEPTTCAIDLSYFRYGTMFYVPSEDRVYIAEDTGPGVRGLWIDTYQEDMSDVIGYNTRYETVYTCEIEYYTVQASNYDVRIVICNTILTF